MVCSRYVPVMFTLFTLCSRFVHAVHDLFTFCSFGSPFGNTRQAWKADPTQRKAPRIVYIYIKTEIYRPKIKRSIKQYPPLVYF